MESEGFEAHGSAAVPHVCTILCVVSERSGWRDGQGKTTLSAIPEELRYGLGCAVQRYAVLTHMVLTHMLAHVCDLVPGTFTHTMGDAHVYLDHLDTLKVQLMREPKSFPELEIAREKGGSIDGWKVEDLVVRGYEPHKGIAMKISV
jgi:thymidylate synthase